MAFDLNARLGLADRMSQKLTKAAESVEHYGSAWGATEAGVKRATKTIGVAVLTMTKTGRAAIRNLGPHMVWLGNIFGATGRFISHNAKMIGGALKSLAERGFERLRKTARNLYTGLKITLPILGGIAVRGALKYADALRQVTSLMASAGATAAELNARYREIDHSIRRMSVEFAQKPQDLARGLYDVYSATFTGAEGLHVLEAASKGAIATLSDASVTTGILTKSLQAYRKEGETNAQVAARSTQVMDQYMASIERGMFRMPELAETFPEVLAMGAAFNVPLEQLLAATSAATRRGVGLEETVTGLRATFVQMASMGPQQKKAAESIFGPDWEKVWGPGALADGGLLGLFEALDEKLPKITPEVMTLGEALMDTHGPGAGLSYVAEQIGVTTEALTGLFPNIRALKLVMALQGPGLDMFAEDFDRITNSAGATDAAVTEMHRSAGFWAEKMRAVWRVLSDDIGRLAFPAITQAGQFTSGWLQDMPARYAAEGGDMARWASAGMDASAMETAWLDKWDQASPYERLYFVITTGWSDLSARLAEWFDTTGSADIAGATERVGQIAAKLFGVGSVEEMGEAGGVFGQIGGAAARGFSEGWREEFEWEDMFSMPGLYTMFKAQVPQLLFNVLSSAATAFMVWRLGKIVKGATGAAGGAGMLARAGAWVSGKLGAATGAVARGTGRAVGQAGVTGARLGGKGLWGLTKAFGKRALGPVGLAWSAYDVLAADKQAKQTWPEYLRYLTEEEMNAPVPLTALTRRTWQRLWGGETSAATGAIMAAGMIPGGGKIIKGGRVALSKTARFARGAGAAIDANLWHARGAVQKGSSAARHAVRDAAAQAAAASATGAKAAGRGAAVGGGWLGKQLWEGLQESEFGIPIRMAQGAYNFGSEVNRRRKILTGLQQAGFKVVPDTAGNQYWGKQFEHGGSMLVDKTLNRVKLFGPDNSLVADAMWGGRKKGWQVLKDLPQPGVRTQWLDEMAQLGVSALTDPGSMGRTARFAGGGVLAAMGATRFGGGDWRQESWAGSRYGPTASGVSPFTGPKAGGSVTTQTVNGGIHATFNIYGAEDPDTVVEKVNSSISSIWFNG